MKWAAVGGAIGSVLLLGACIVRDRPPPPRYYYYGYYPPAPPPPGPPPRMLPPPPPGVPGPPSFVDRPGMPPAPTPHPQFPARIVHPLPLADAGAQFLDVRGLEAMVLRLRPNRRCGPRQLDGGHWIHLDCNVHAPVKSAKAFTPDKLDLLLQGLLNLDTPISIPGIGTLPRFPGSAPGTAPAPTPAPTHAPSPAPGTTVKPRLGVLPDSVDHRRDGTEGPVKDQGQVGCCTAFSLSTAMDNAIRRQNSSDTTSTLHIWSHYANPIVQDAGDRNLHKPIALWASWPYDERTACELDTSSDHDCGPYFPPVIQGSGSRDPQVQAKIRESDAGGQWQITEYDAIPRDADTIAAFLATGADVWGSMDIGNDWLHVTGDTVARLGLERPRRRPRARVRGVSPRQRAAPVPRPQQLGGDLGRPRVRLPVRGHAEGLPQDCVQGRRRSEGGDCGRGGCGLERAHRRRLRRRRAGRRDHGPLHEDVRGRHAPRQRQVPAAVIAPSSRGRFSGRCRRRRGTSPASCRRSTGSATCAPDARRSPRRARCGCSTPRGSRW